MQIEPIKHQFFRPLVPGSDTRAPWLCALKIVFKGVKHDVLAGS